MKFYKLELVNREENFTQKFAGNAQQNNANQMMGGGVMNVGVMDPLAFGKKKGDENTKLPQLGRMQQKGSFGSQRGVGSR
eukprot:CAMPEP_0172025602 /NCGR_PEP_ID=MMETSP1041-20130122/15988_1 /TAXON_ID=464988 /ORGANISM="Hemiselmis andersenii, Strain CCMP439" /LENGTH=79 /DNA_ID=CAMNT_0012681315 /DNA_START=15 /DNA_END=251 /DNA_ORIENTATION=+